MTKVVACSDLHGNLPEIPPCDILLISGDICPNAGAVPVEVAGQIRYRRVAVGSSDDLWFQRDWLRDTFKPWADSVPAKHIVACWGNHDFIGEKKPDFVPKDIRWHILTDQLIEVEGLKIFASPWQLFFYQWAFNAPEDPYEGERFLERKYSAIPADTDIIITHGPPRGYGDRANDGRTGSHALIKRIKEIGPRLVVTGHIHEDFGQWEIDTGNRPPTIIANCSVLNRDYRMVREPVVFEI